MAAEAASRRPAGYTTIGNLCDEGVAHIQTGPFGSQLHAHDYRPVGTAVIPTEAIGRGRILNVALPKVGPDVAARLSRHALQEGDILFARRGAQATGLSAIVEPRHTGSLCGTGAILLRFVDRRRVLPEYLALALSDQGAVSWLKDNAVGAVMPNLNADIIRRLSVRIPPLAEQRAIAHILGTLDDKIELNRRTNETLEAMARALFKSWFVDFDPVRAKAAGKQPSGMDAATAALFPSEFEDSHLGETPKGWRCCIWGDLATLEYGRALRGYQSASGFVPVFGTNGQIGLHTQALCSHPGIIVGRKGAYRGIHYSDRPFYVIDTAFFLEPRAPISWRWAFHELRRFNLNGMDSGSAIPSTSRDQFYCIPVCAPPYSIQRAFEDQLAANWEHQHCANAQSDVMVSLRDALLPRLLSGELRIPDAERVVESAT